ncbi:MAG: hypothetical protein ABSG81_13290 [Acidimicrobiales bacterium]|jgi:hypothetical protein
MSVDLGPAEAGAPAGVLAVWARGDHLGYAQLALQGTDARIGVVIDGTSAFERDDLRDLLIELVQRSGAQGARRVDLDCFSLLVRHEARRIGFVGPLRRPLVAAVDDVATKAVGTGEGPRSEPDGGQASRPLDQAELASSLAGALAAWGIPATPVRARRGLGRITSRLALGVADTLDVAVHWAPGRTVTIGVPDRADLMPEAVALAAQTTVGVLGRFPEQAGVVASIRFDRSTRGLTTGHYGGTADRSAGAIHLNIDYVAADAMVAMTRRQAARAAGQGPPRGQRFTYGTLRGAASAAAPFTFLDATVAHELWHQLESAFEHRHYRASVELRRGLGEVLGVETLERAIKGNERNAPEAWRSAYEQLARQVSPYATTNVTEATAEIFKLWWCRTGAVSPVVARFGELIDQLLPPQPTGAVSI